MKKTLLTTISILIFSSSPLFAQEPGYRYSKPELNVLIDSSDREFNTDLELKLKSNLSSRFEINFGDAISSQRTVRIDNVKIRNEKTSGGREVFYTITASIKTFGLAKKDGKDKHRLHVFERSEHKDVAYIQAVTKIAEEIADICLWTYPIAANIRDIDGKLVYVDRGRESVLNRNDYCYVYDGNKKVGVIRIISSSGSSSVAKIYAGKDDIEIGNSVKTIHHLNRYGLGLDYSMVPVSASVGESYSSLSGAIVPELETANILMMSLFVDFTFQRSQLALSAGVINIDDMTNWMGEVSLSPSAFIHYERLSFNIKLASGILILDSQDYMRPAGNYTDGLDDIGKTKINHQWYFRIEPGLRFFISEDFSISAFGGYFYSGKGDDWSKDVGTGEDKKTVDLESEWLRYDHIQTNGFYFGVRLSFTTLLDYF